MQMFMLRQLGKKMTVLLISDNIDSVSNVKVIDIENKYLVPGFIDQHVHLTGAGG